MTARAAEKAEHGHDEKRFKIGLPQKDSGREDSNEDSDDESVKDGASHLMCADRCKAEPLGAVTNHSHSPRRLASGASLSSRAAVSAKFGFGHLAAEPSNFALDSTGFGPDATEFGVVVGSGGYVWGGPRVWYGG